MALRDVAIIIEPARPYDRRIIRGVAAYVEEHRKEWSLYVEEDPIARLPDLEAWGGDGILANFDDHRIADAVLRMGVPIVGVGGGYGYYPLKSKIPYVKTNNQEIAALAARHLLDLGFRRFAFCSEPANKVNGWARERAKAFRETIEQEGFACDTYVGRYTAARNWRRLQDDLQDWLLTLRTPVGVMACHDGRARHLLQASREVGLRVPEDLAVIGVDNDDIMCELSRPPLTSIEQGTRRIGYEAAALLNQMMEGHETPTVFNTVEPEGLVLRQSTEVLAVEDQDVETALRFIRQHACDPINVEDVLHHVQLSRSTLENRFRAILNRTIHAEIRRVQIDSAKRLLTSTNIPIKEIVNRVGISSVQYFTSMIRRATGKTPRQIRDESQF